MILLQRTRVKNRMLILALLSIIGILLNVLPAKLVLFFHIPIFFDCFGTVLVTLTGGILPGVIAGFFSNVINGLDDPITIYYSFISVLIAAALAALKHYGFFERISGILLSILIISLVGGGLGSLFTWLLYGFSFGEGISAPLAYALYNTGLFSKFLSQFLADMAIDLLDKAFVVSAGVLVYRNIPENDRDFFRIVSLEEQGQYFSSKGFFRGSILGKIILFLLTFEAVLAVIVLLICFLIYRGTLMEKYMSMAESASLLESKLVNGERIPAYLEKGDKATDYGLVRQQLLDIRDSFDELKYLYVYHFQEDGVCVVFDMDSPEEDSGEHDPGDAPGTMIDYEESFVPYKSAALRGEPIGTIETRDEYGWLMSAYTPIKNESGKVMAYACADIRIGQLVVDEEIFLIKVFSMIFGASIIILSVLLDIADRKLIHPIRIMERAASGFAYESEDGRRKSLEHLKNLGINTEDELSSLYHALTELASDSVAYIEKTRRDAETITSLQEGIIIDFANMVESRDKNTGDHIKKTSFYVGKIAEEMIRQGMYPDQLDEQLAKSMVRSAPLHDVGKIAISDTILNKPGKLTKEEFDLMKTHTTEGRKILSETLVSTSGTGYLKESIEMAYCHHERWDGDGYPQGLKGEEIPLTARVMAVADVFDALVSQRSYKDPFPFDKAVDIIREESGTHFDPQVVKAFLDIAESFRDIVAKNLDETKSDRGGQS